MKKLLFLTVIFLTASVTGCVKTSRSPAGTDPLSFYLVTDKAGPSSLKIKTADGKEELFLEPTPSITIEDIDSAKVEPVQWPQEIADAFRRKGITPPPFKILIKCTPDGRKKLFKVTSENLRKTLAVVSGGKLLAAPRILESIPGGELAIQGNISAKEALLLAREINDRKGPRRAESPQALK